VFPRRRRSCGVAVGFAVDGGAGGGDRLARLPRLAQGVIARLLLIADVGGDAVLRVEQRLGDGLVVPERGDQPAGGGEYSF
jgi:hypothetical protein